MSMSLGNLICPSNALNTARQGKKVSYQMNNKKEELTLEFQGGLSMCFPEYKIFLCAVKGFSDAHILLSPCDGCGKGYEIVIGGWNNNRSVIREDVHYPWPGFADTHVS